MKDGDLKAAIHGIRAMNFDGINLTMPHKVEVLNYVDELSESVQLIGSSNTIVNRDGKLTAYNTDGQGFVEGMRRSGISLLGKQLVILGAGGAARAIAAECALAGASKIVIINRNEERGHSIVSMLNERTSCSGSFLKWTEKIAVPSCDILINATCVGMFNDADVPDIDYSSLSASVIVQDIVPKHTPFLKKIKSMGNAAYDGFSMLVYQGAIAFHLWTGVEADTEIMISALAAATGEQR